MKTPACRIKRALISVSDKSGIAEFARGLSQLGIEIVSTGGTYKAIADAGISVVYISDVTHFPEILDGRVKTLHPAVHGGILARRNDPSHQAALEKEKIVPIDLVAVNLYPFREVASRVEKLQGDLELFSREAGAIWDELIENIDIGGPAMIRSAAKNHEDVLVLVRPEDYEFVLRRLRDDGDCTKGERVRLALEAFRHTAEYDACIQATLTSVASSMSQKEEVSPRENFPREVFPYRLAPETERASILRYGENPAQPAALYRDSAQTPSFVDALQLQGKELSYNNWLDADSAFKIIQEFDGKHPAAAVVKHTNPCGAALGETIEDAFRKAYETDPVSAFGGILAVNRPVTKKLAEALRGVFWEVILAPGYSEEAREVLAAKTNLRFLEVPKAAWPIRPALEWRSVQGGFLVQERDLQSAPPDTWTAVTARKPTETELEDLAFAWKIVKQVKSNAIALAKGRATVGIGAGQMNRVGAAKIALEQAGEKARGAVLASDAFFPFADTVRLAAKSGITAIVQPGGSLRDQESADAADEFGIAMVHTGVRHFKH
ncbi:MAG: bifunctional phosphoribosylaminoimidazolecarboxamide formyltransferase/IMP cyclohydrolase [Synergistaceae bacterium]|jgi:phosphoribosylaminoimidazolecarboxamide formyltransferase/IMP cyclohydrolase|nr:bifunctional phosphoribosylaminoimidazolecarboxamide formyltransferase/IMP cyclohydrolase [Synergistaceae bacterium]